jgi:hypothetical protein
MDITPVGPPRSEPRRRTAAVIATAVAGTVMTVAVGVVASLVVASALRNGAATAAAPSATVAISISAAQTSSEPSRVAPSQTAQHQSPSVASTSGGTEGPCDNNPRATASTSYSNGAPLILTLVSTIPGEPVCARASVTISWISYWYDNTGKQLEAGGASFSIPDMTTDVGWTPHVDIDPGCPGDLYVMADLGTSWLNELAAGVHHPYPIASATNGWHGEILSFVNQPTVCTHAGLGTYTLPPEPPATGAQTSTGSP